MSPHVDHCPACGVILSDRKAQRSHRSHGHFFARVNAAWDTMPDKLKKRWPSAVHLRKWALIKSGYCDIELFQFDTPEDAKTASTALKRADSYALVSVRDAEVRYFTAQSQSLEAMGKDDFQKSKDAVFNVIGELIGADPANIPEAA